MWDLTPVGLQVGARLRLGSLLPPGGGSNVYRWVSCSLHASWSVSSLETQAATEGVATQVSPLASRALRSTTFPADATSLPSSFRRGGCSSTPGADLLSFTFSLALGSARQADRDVQDRVLPSSQGLRRVRHRQEVQRRREGSRDAVPLHQQGQGREPSVLRVRFSAPWARPPRSHRKDSNLSLKINVKLRGINSILDPASLGPIAQCPTSRLFLC